MPSLLLTLALLAADPISTLLLEVNVARVTNDQLPVAADPLLAQAASLQTEWLSVARRYGGSLSDHHVQTAWLLREHPELRWDRLLATYGGTLPEWLGSFDLARLCEFNQAVRDIVHIGGRNADPVGAWLQSPTHRTTLLWSEAEYVGLDTRRAKAGNFVTVAIFGNQE